jgi:hypothetical protein
VLQECCMGDFIFLGLGVLGFALLVLYVKGSGRL